METGDSADAEIDIPYHAEATQLTLNIAAPSNPEDDSANAAKVGPGDSRHIVVFLFHKVHFDECAVLFLSN